MQQQKASCIEGQSEACACVVECLGQPSEGWGQCWNQCDVDQPTQEMNDLYSCWADECGQFHAAGRAFTHQFYVSQHSARGIV